MTCSRCEVELGETYAVCFGMPGAFCSADCLDTAKAAWPRTYWRCGYCGLVGDDFSPEFSRLDMTGRWCSNSCSVKAHELGEQRKIMASVGARFAARWSN